MDAKPKHKNQLGRFYQLAVKILIQQHFFNINILSNGKEKPTEAKPINKNPLGCIYQLETHF